MKSQLILILSTILYSVIHSLTASNLVKTHTRDWFRSSIDRWYRFLYNVWAGISFLPIIWLLCYLPDNVIYTIPMPWVFLTTLVQFVGVAVIIIGILQTGALSFIGIQQLIWPDTFADTPLFTTGLYNIVRHPLFTGGLLVIWGTPILTHNILTLFILLTIYLVIGARLEEKRMLQNYKDQYKQYQNEVPMLIPRINRRR